MIYTDIDIVSHFTSVISQDDEVLKERFQFPNDLEGFCSFSLILDTHDQDPLLIGLESTAPYVTNLTVYTLLKEV